MRILSFPSFKLSNPTLGPQRSAKNSSTAIPAARISARSVPTESSSCVVEWKDLPECPFWTSPRDFLPAPRLASRPFQTLSRPHCPRCWRAAPFALASTPSHGYDNLRAIRPHRLHRLLVLSPEPGGNRFFDIFQRLFLVTSLRYATRQRGALRYDPAVFSLLQRNVEEHGQYPFTRTGSKERAVSPSATHHTKPCSHGPAHNALFL